MLRKFALLPLVAAAALLVSPAADAAPLSPNNPYRSFNISGVNYGSSQWEQSHHNTRTRPASSGGLRLFRRR